MGMFLKPDMRMMNFLSEIAILTINDTGVRSFAELFICKISETSHFGI